MKKQSGFTLVEMVIVIMIPVMLAAIYGWINNILVIAAADFSQLTGLIVLRCIGIFVPPLGAILGFV